MVDRQKCSGCGGLGRVMTLDKPPEDPYSEEGWEDCPRCRGTGVEMANVEFEVYVRFTDQVDAEAFMERVADEHNLKRYGLRRREPGDDDLVDRIFRQGE